MGQLCFPERPQQCDKLSQSFLVCVETHHSLQPHHILDGSPSAFAGDQNNVFFLPAEIKIPSPSSSVKGGRDPWASLTAAGNLCNLHTSISLELAEAPACIGQKPESCPAHNLFCNWSPKSCHLSLLHHWKPSIPHHSLWPPPAQPYHQLRMK